jgi:protein FAM50
VTREEFKRKRENIDNIIEQDKKEKEENEAKKKLQSKIKRKEEYLKKTTLLSFDVEHEEEATPKINQTKVDPEQFQKKASSYGKDTTVDTSFLPDVERDKQIQDLKKFYTGNHSLDNILQTNSSKSRKTKRINSSI